MCPLIWVLGTKPRSCGHVCSVDQAGLEPTEIYLSESAFGVLGLKAYATRPGLVLFFETSPIDTV